MPVKNKIKQYLDSRGITRYQFRKDTGVAQRTAYDLYDKPEQLPSPDVLRKICDAYEIQPGEILEWVKK
ncbi:helix-turn-helix transcriptional regulator [Chroococcidiopsis sp. CCMEE 29]|uniref:helix-turn-helix domain-containing protein n=1 Tax=Chroococcidiopsis sp. CCMEE 29 TaxID=155894 RepID=UPI0020228ABA|nr:helix-turn-helix transcriptional regulator [Chroococcidiopsis sp. CCMEE 29]